VFISENLIQHCSVKISKEPLGSQTANLIELEEKCAAEVSERSEKIRRFIPGIQSNCIYCIERFVSRSALIRHVKGFHRDIQNICCQFCSLLFSNRNEKKKHTKDFHAMKCLYCKEGIFWLKEKLRKHVKEVHKKEIFQCNYNKKCILYFKSQIALREHVENVHESGEDKFKCVYCNKLVKSLFVGQHMRLNHKSEVIRCKYRRCQTYFLSEGERDKHILEVHKSGKLAKKGSCFYCKKHFPDKYQVAIHIKRCHSDVKIKCRFHKCCQYFHTQKACSDGLRQRASALAPEIK